MKICSNCQRKNTDHAKFCIYCGSKLNDTVRRAAPEKGKTRQLNRKYVLAALPIIVVAGAAFGFLLVKTVSASSYQEKIAMGDRYYLDEDFKKAEEYYLEAKKIEPKRTDAYEKLYQVYLETDQSDKENEIQKEAADHLEEDDHELLNRTVKEIRNKREENSKEKFEDDLQTVSSDEGRSENDEDDADSSLPGTPGKDVEPGKKQEMRVYQAPGPDQTVIADLGSLDFAPVDIPGYGWMIRNRQGFQFLRPDGKLYSIPKKVLSETGQPESDYADCILGQNDLDNTLSEAAFNGKAKACEQTSQVSSFSVYTKNKDQLASSVSPKLEDSSAKRTEETPEKPIFVSEKGKPDWNDRQPVKNMMEDQKYFIYLPDEKKFLGPYEMDQNASYALQILHDVKSESFWQLKNSQDLLGAFWEKTDEGYRLYSSDAKKRLENLKDILIVSPRVIGAFDTEKFTLYDSDLNIIYQIRADGGAAPVDGAIPILEGKTWKLVRLEDLKLEDSTRKDSEQEVSLNEKDQKINQNQNQEVSSVQPSDELVAVPDGTAENQISLDQALTIAKEYWNSPDPDKFAVQIDGNGPVNRNGTLYYHFRLRSRIENHLSTVDEVYVNLQTGETTYIPGG